MVAGRPLTRSLVWRGVRYRVLAMKKQKLKVLKATIIDMTPSQAADVAGGGPVTRLNCPSADGPCSNNFKCNTSVC